MTRSMSHARFLILFALVFGLPLTPVGQAESNGGGLEDHTPLEPRTFTLVDRFLEAARQGDVATIERSLELGVDIDSADALGRTAIILAAKDAGSFEVVKLLRSRGASLDPVDVNGRDALSFAAGRGRIEILRFLRSEGRPIDTPDAHGRRPLYHAAASSHAEVVELLLEQGADPDARDRFGDTALILVCAKGNDDIAKILREGGADATLTDREGRTAADRARTPIDACQPAPQRGADPA